jgi:hypothetical protein
MYNGPMRNLCFKTTVSLTTGRENNITDLLKLAFLIKTYTFTGVLISP